MKQQCYLAMVWLTWIGLPLLALAVGFRVGAVAGIVVLVVGFASQPLYIKWFPRISRMMGYGSVDDTPAADVPQDAKLPGVTLYTANLCPFCPILKRRLADLQRQHEFAVQEVDVTFRPEIIRAKGLRSVPVLEANGQLLAGNATSAQIVEFLTRTSTTATR